MIKPKDWSEVNLKQYSAYNEILVSFQEEIKDLNPEVPFDCELILLKQSSFEYDCCVVFSGEPADEVANMEYGLIKSYYDDMAFLMEKPEDETLKSFEFKGLTYTMPHSIKLDTKYGQYIEAMQSEMAWNAQNKDSLLYLAHQLAHQVDYGEGWKPEDRDKLAVKFEEVPMSVFFKFCFFLQTQSVICLAVHSRQLASQKRAKLPITKRALLGWVTLKRYMNWQSAGFLISLIRLQLTVSYIQIRARFFNIFPTSRRKVTTSI